MMSATEQQPTGTNNAPQDLVSVAESLVGMQQHNNRSKPATPPTPGGVGFPLSTSTVSSDDEGDCNNSNVEQQQQHFQLPINNNTNSPLATTTTLPAESTTAATTTDDGPWTTSEHTLFLTGIRKHGFNWSKISSEHVKTRTPRQCRLHSIKDEDHNHPPLTLTAYPDQAALDKLDDTTLHAFRKIDAFDRDTAAAKAEAAAEAKAAAANTTTAEGRWTTQEHNAFIEAVNKYGRRWKLISLHVKTRSPDQCRSHGQKYFKRFEKNMLEMNGEKRLLLDLSDESEEGSDDGDDGGGGGEDKPRKKRRVDKDVIRKKGALEGLGKLSKKQHTAKDVDEVQEGETTTNNSEKKVPSMMPLWIWSVIFTPVGNWRSGKDVDDRVMMHCKAIKLLMSMKFMSITPNNPSSSPNSIGNENSSQWHEQRNRRFASILRCFEELHYQSSPSLDAYKDVSVMKARLRLFIVHVLGMAPKILGAPGECWQDEVGDLKMREKMRSDIVSTIASKKPNAPRIWTDFVQRDSALKCFEELHYWMAPSREGYQHEGFMKQMLALFARKYLKRWRGCVFQ